MKTVKVKKNNNMKDKYIYVSLCYFYPRFIYYEIKQI